MKNNANYKLLQKKKSPREVLSMKSLRNSSFSYGNKLNCRLEQFRH